MFRIEKYKAAHRQGRCFKTVRGLAVLLCLILCLESMPLTALAAEPGMESLSENTAAEDQEAPAEDGDVPPTEPPTENEDTPSGEEVQPPAEGEDTPSTEEGQGPPAEGEDAPPTEELPPTELPAEGEDTPPAEEVPPTEDTEQVSGNDTGSVSENDFTAVSDNDLSSVSENDLDAEREAMIEEAQRAFAALAAEKPLMALLYHADSYQARREADTGSEAVAVLEIGQTLYLQGVVITEDDVWYQVQYLLNGAEGLGYVQSYYLAYSDEDWLAWEEEYLLPILQSGEDTYRHTAYGMRSYSMMTYAVDTSDISAFPGSYQADLRNLKSAHPNWTFVPMKTGLDFATSVSQEMGDRSLIQKTNDNTAKGWVGDVCPIENGWYYATQPAVAYHMDPRNFLTESYIFQFEQLTFNASYHTEAAVQSFLNNTFMKGKLADDSAGRTYAGAFYEIGKNRKLSPIHLASRVYQEQGQGTSGLISGTYPGYQGYYNYFNVGVNGASEAEKIIKGLTYAKNQGWNTRYKSLDGGAATIGKNYILKYQDTIYLEKFNVDKNSPYGLYNHQYMQNIQAPRSESYSTKKMYANAGTLNSAFVFKIPVYNNMPNDTYYPALKLDQTSLTMKRSEDAANPTTQQLKFFVDEVEADPAEAKWASSDTKVATVNQGLVTAVDLGEAVITASYRNVEVSCKVTVKAPLRKITLDKEKVTLRRPDTVVTDTKNLSAQEKAENISQTGLRVSFDPADTTADRTIVWTSANQKIAKVTADPEDSSKATVTAVGTGEVKITAKASKAGNQTAVCVVKVIAPIYQVTLTNRNIGEDAAENRTTLLAGQSVNLSAEYLPKDTTSDTQVKWSSSAPDVATVINGKVTAVGGSAKGNTAVIKAEIAGYEASYTVTVETCTVTFRNRDGKTALGKPIVVNYGDVLAEEIFQEKRELLGDEPSGSRFIGWYTGVGGTGSRFDETSRIHAKELVLYPYDAKLYTGFYVLPVGDQTYTGSAVKPKVQVFDGTVRPDGELLQAEDRECLALREGVDYTVSYKNNKHVSLAGKPVPTIVVKGKGNYGAAQQIFFDIVPKALTDTDITADDMTVAYSGKVIKSAPSVWRNGKKLVRNTDYTVEYPLTGTGAYQTAGVYPVVIKGKGGYTGTITVYETITKKTLMSKVSVAKIANRTYTNEEMAAKGGIRPDSLKVTFKKETLAESTDGGRTGDYTVTYTNDGTVGTATATITAVEGSAYVGSKSVTYKIVRTPIARAKTEGLVPKVYAGADGDVGQSGYVLTLGEETLVESTDGGRTGDYTASYAGAAKSGALKAGTATIIFQGINEYSGQLKKSYKILPYELNPEEVGKGRDIILSYHTQDEPETELFPTGINDMTTPYVKGGSKPVIKLTFRGQTLVQGKDYTVTYQNHNALTTAEMEEKKLPAYTIKGKGNFRGTIKGTFTITDGRLDKEGKISMTLKDVVYREKKNAYKPKVTIRDVSGAALAAGKDYDKNLQYSYARDAKVLVAEEGVLVERERKAGDFVGEDDIPQKDTQIRVTAKGMGAYAGQGEQAPEISAVYRIVAADIAKAKVKTTAKSYQDGRPVMLSAQDLTLTVSGVEQPLEYGVDYRIDETSYINNTKKGKAKVTLYGMGNYGGEKTITYNIGVKTLWW